MPPHKKRVKIFPMIPREQRDWLDQHCGDGPGMRWANHSHFVTDAITVMQRVLEAEETARAVAIDREAR